jgi:hypothetical protein
MVVSNPLPVIAILPVLAIMIWGLISQRIEWVQL